MRGVLSDASCGCGHDGACCGGRALALLVAGAARVQPPDAASCTEALQQQEAKNAALELQLAQTSASALLLLRPE